MDNFEWVLDWMGHLVQRPEEKPGTALVLRGAKGTGKDTVGRYLGALFRPHHVTVSKPEHLTGQFNAHMERALLLHIEEAVWAGDRRAESVLKSLITSPTIQIERKGIDPVEMPSFCRLLFTSNADWVVPATDGERRYMVLDVSAARAKDTVYFAAISAECENGGAGALLHILRERDLSGFDVRNPPETAALMEQKLAGLGNAEAWWQEVLSAGETPGDLFGSDPRWEDGPITVPRDVIREHYIGYMRSKRYGETMGEREFGKMIRRLCPGLTDKRITVDGSMRRWVYQFPSLAECRNAFERKYGGAIDWNV